MSKVNPKIKKIAIGIRNPKEIILFPLAVASELEMTELLTASLSAVFAARSVSDPDGNQSQTEAARQFLVVRELLNVLRANMAQIVTIATCEEEDGAEILKETDNDQFMDILDAVFEVNFAPLFQRVPEMMKRWGPVLGIDMSLSEKSQPTSVETAVDTDLNMSTEETGLKEGSPEAS